MTVTFRRARESDREHGFNWKPYRTMDGPYKPWVMAVDGAPVVAFGENAQVVFQNDSPGVADLIRAHKSILRALTKGTTDPEAADRRLAKSMRDLRDAAR